MGIFAAGQVVSLPFPFTDLSQAKVRPALLLAHAGRTDWIACQITSNPYADLRPLTIAQTAFLEGGLRHTSYLRPGKLFTVKESLIIATLGTLHSDILDAARDALIALLRNP